jgi:predicted RNA binding protein YcfA (HicA-like mRNA interferase family)
MRVPRDISGEELAKALSCYGYQITRQAGSHLRLTTTKEGKHHITIPKHNPLKIGTLNAIILDVAEHLCLSKSEVYKNIFE